MPPAWIKLLLNNRINSLTNLCWKKQMHTNLLLQLLSFGVLWTRPQYKRVLNISFSFKSSKLFVFNILLQIKLKNHTWRVWHGRIELPFGARASVSKNYVWTFVQLSWTIRHLRKLYFIHKLYKWGACIPLKSCHKIYLELITNL